MYMDDIIAFFIGVIGVIVSLAATILFLMCLWAWIPGPLSCSAFGDGMKVKTDYRFWYGCFVTMPNGEILPESVAVKVLQQKYQVEVSKP